MPPMHALPPKQSLLVWHVSPAIDLLVHMPGVTPGDAYEFSHPFVQFEAAAASGGVGAASRSTSSGTSTTTPEEELAKAAAEYEGALREELELRSIVPALGWRLDFPDDPATRDEDRAAARRYLGLDITEDGTLVDLGGS